MALKRFENRPSTDTPINADNLNNNFDYFKNNTLIASLHTDFTVVNNKQYTQLPLIQDLRVGDKLSLTNDGGIKIGADVNYVKIYFSVAFNVSTQDNRHLRIVKNNDVDNTVLWRYKAIDSNVSDYIDGYSIVEVQENDVIYVYYYANSGDIIAGNTYGLRTSLIVETLS